MGGNPKQTEALWHIRPCHLPHLLQCLEREHLDLNMSASLWGTQSNLVDEVDKKDEHTSEGSYESEDKAIQGNFEGEWGCIEGVVVFVER